ncbi:hypothetical protein L1987_53772 [Smallanthus sonchifolius]|uniref:Uncharacterized protein n=1 Tax=Smallanthus sonchifolius TaxID=185202 RepID=A0ACB9EXG2_9ASTR|nr:hypothetical protein L1987_53772 [Smallanthus sonchifolius]
MNGIVNIWNQKGLGLGLIGNKKGSTSNGFESWGPSSTLPHPYEEVLENTLNGIEDIEFTRMDTLTPSVNEESPVLPTKRGEKQKDRESLNSKLIEVGDNINEMAKVLIEKHKVSNDMEACVAKLETMEWEELDAKYQTALLLFGESVDLRKVSLLLKPQSCEPWVKNAVGEECGSEVWIVLIFYFMGVMLWMFFRMLCYECFVFC